MAKKLTAEEIEAEKKEFNDFLVEDIDMQDEEDYGQNEAPVEGTSSAQNTEEGEEGEGTDIGELESVTKGEEAEVGKPEDAQKAAESGTEPETPSPKAQEVEAASPEAKAQEPVAAAPAPAPASTEPAKAEPEKHLSAEEVGEVYTNWRSTTEDLLATHHYNLSQEEIDELEAEPQRFIAKFGSRVYLDAVSACIGQITMHLPQMVRMVNEQEKANAATENQFFDRWPKLKEHQAQVLQIGQAFRNQNPSASMEDFINNVGAMAMVSLRLDPSQPVPPAASQTPGFVPAASTPVGGIPKKPSNRNPFDIMDEEFYMEDLDT